MLRDQGFIMLPSRDDCCVVDAASGAAVEFDAAAGGAVASMSLRASL